MNTFLTILCLALMASASAKPAYNYPQPSKGFNPSQSSSNSGIYSANLSQQIKANFDVSSSGLAAPAATQNALNALAAPNIGLAAPSQFAQQFTAPTSQFVDPVQPQQFAPVQQQQLSGSIQQQQQFLSPASSVSQYQPINYQQQSQQQPQQQTIISKDIYIHSAPEEIEEIGNDPANFRAGPIRKNYRIVFIKAPTQNVKLNLDALKRSQASNEEKTVIYVLSKKPDLSEIQGQLSAVQNEQKAHKPEVYFIKYKTQEEANRAQQEIQAQYDSLGGSTHISDEGIAPVHSVIGGGAINVGNIGSNNFGQQQFSAQSYQSSQSSVGSSSSTIGFGGVPSQKYLPVKKK